MKTRGEPREEKPKKQSHNYKFKHIKIQYKKSVRFQLNENKTIQSKVEKMVF